MIYAADKVLRDFLGISSIRNPAIFNNRNYEDPTYPIFHIKFAFNPPEALHPDYVTNRLLSKLEDESSAINDESAIKYLYNVGEPERAIMLKKFNIALRSISEKTPWYFQGIDRLEELFKHSYESERGERDLRPVILTIKTLESLDYKITSLKDLYRKASYDRKFRRWVLPQNMRRFRMTIMVGDYRQMAKTEDNFSITGSSLLSTLRDVDIFNSSNVGGQLVDRVAEGKVEFIKRLQWWDEHFSCLVFDCQDCEFDMNSFSPSTINHNELKNPMTSGFNIKVGRVLETHTYSLLEYITSDNTFENFLKNNDKPRVITQSRKLKNIVKPIVSSWKSFPNLEREKGNNRRIILDDNGVGQAVRGTINEALDFLGLDTLFEGTNEGESGGFLGSVEDFFGDTLSGVAQELVGQATEQLVTNIFTDDFLRTTAGIGLGILGGDIRNGNRTGNRNQPNLRENLPTKLDLKAPTVQKSLTDIQANLSGSGSDPRFRSISRPGRNLFITPETDLSLEGNQRVFLQESLYLEPPRIQTTMPEKIEFEETRKETSLSPNQANLTGAGKKMDLIPNNAELNGAQPLNDLIPNNAELNGAQPLNDLIPNNAELNGAQPLKDLIPNNAELNGAQPKKQINSDNIILQGADKLENFNSTRIMLEGSNAENTFNNSNVGLTGSRNNSRLTTKNISLSGAKKLSNFNKSNEVLDGVDPKTEFNQQNIELMSNNVSNNYNLDNIILSVPKTLDKFSETQIELNSPSILTSISENNANLSSPSVQTILSDNNINFNQIEKNETIDSKNLNLTGSSTLKNFNDLNVQFNEIRINQNIDVKNENLQGSDSIKSFTETNIGNMINDSTLLINTLGSEELTGNKPYDNMSEQSMDLTGSTPIKEIVDINIYSDSERNGNNDILSSLTKMNTLKNINQDNPNYNTLSSINSIPNLYRSKGIYGDGLSVSNSGGQSQSTPTTVNLLGSKPITDFTSEQVELQGSQPKTRMDENEIEFEGAPKLESLNPKKIIFDGSKPMTSFETSNVNLSDNSTLSNFNSKGVELLGINKLTEFNESMTNLEGIKPTNELNEKNIEFKKYTTNNNTITDVNLELRDPAVQNKQSLSSLELKFNEPYSANPNYDNQSFINDLNQQTMPFQNIDLNEQKISTPIRNLNVGVQVK